MKKPSTWITAICTACICVVALVFAFAPVSPLRQGGDTAPFASIIDPAEAENEGTATVKPVANATDDEGAQETPDGESPGYEKGTVLVALEEGLTLDQARDIIVKETDLQDVRIEAVTDSYAKVTFNEQASVKDAVKAIATSGAAATAQPNFEYYPDTSDAAVAQEAFAQTGALAALDASELTTEAATINDPKSSKWALENVEAFEAWDLLKKDKTTTNVTVAVIDVGFRLTHEEFTGNFVYDAKTGKYNKPLIVAPYNSYTNKTGANNIKVEESHGSHVMGIIAAHVNNGKGIAGITNNLVQIMPIQAFDVTGDKTDTVAMVRAIDYVAKNASTYNVRVINMSIGGGVSNSNWPDDDLLIMDSIAKAHDKGIVAVASAGNANKRFKPPFYHTPSDFEQCVAVINLENTNPAKPSVVRRYETSNYNVSGQMAKDIAAPGSDIVSASVKDDSKYVEYSGTSMAAPMVAGIMALMFTADNSLSVDEAVSKLYTGAAPLYSKELKIGDPVWSEEFGYGDVNAKNAVRDISFLSGATSIYVNERRAYKLNLPKGVGDTKNVKWEIYSSTNGKLVSFDQRGTKAYLKGMKPGECVIMATATVSSKKYQAFQTITVYDNAMNGYSKMRVGSKERFYPSSAPTSNNRSWKWTTSNPKVATVSSNGTVTAWAKGTAVITATSTKNSKVVSKQKLTVVPAALDAKSSNVVGTYSDPTYTGSPLKPPVTVCMNKGKDNEIKLVQGKDYTVSYRNNVNAGKETASIELTALPGSLLCSGDAELTFTINPAPMDDVTISGVANRKYTGKTVPAQKLTLKLGKQALKQGTDYTVSYLDKNKKPISAANVKAKGTYYVKVVGKGNFTGSATKSFKVA